MIGPLKANKEEFEMFQEFIQDKIGLKFPESKKSLLESRLSSHIGKLGFNSFGEYFKYIGTLSELDEEIDYLVDKITTHTTSFFRENHHFDFLLSKGIDILVSVFGKINLKIMCLGSSTGEEMYTLAMILESQKKTGKILGYTIDGADISKYALLKAKEGVFKIDHLDSIPKQYIGYFDVKENKIFAKSILKNNLRFFLLNIAKPKQRFPDKYHIVFCRNTLIYFNKELQQNVINNVEKILISGGLYFMGHSESLHGLTHNFERVEPTIYQGGS
ncbi:MAG TPA: CheR family methyltransferase [Spirochaetota bacterium]|mgnify:CR=1 FL=1|nr:CheR family methyltransferase [Spirochaetota bacterium]